MTDRIDVNRLLVEMRALKLQTQAFGAVNPATSQDKVAEAVASQRVDFGNVMSQALDQVNEVQQASKAIRQSYLQGDNSVDVTDVMIASQKAGVAFDAMVQVRNKLVEAYRDVMNMPV